MVGRNNRRGRRSPPFAGLLHHLAELIEGQEAAHDLPVDDEPRRAGDVETLPQFPGALNFRGDLCAVHPLQNRGAVPAEAFGDAADGLSISSTKSMHGHGIGAAGALEAAAVLMAMKEGVVPPTINHVEDDPDCLGLDVTPNDAKERDVPAALSNSFAFGGLNAVLAFRRI